MNVLLVYPEIPDTFWSFKHALKFISKRSAFPPLGLLTVAAMLPREWSLRLVDANIRRITKKDLAWAECVFISAMVIQRESTSQLISRCKEAGLKIIAGGPLFTMEPEEFKEVDHLILNEAELTLPPFLEDLNRGEPQKLYATSEFADIKQSPVPMWSLVNLRDYATMSIQFSRGCPFNCDFCNVTALLGHKFRIKSSAQIIEELDSIHAQGWRGTIFFVDDNLIGNTRFLKSDLLPALIDWQSGKDHIKFITQASINLVDDPTLMDMMVKAGFDTVFIGIETPDKNCLLECGKNQNKNRALLEDVKLIQRAGLQVQGGFIVGFDHDLPSIFERQIDFIQKSGIVTAMVGLLQAPIGTRLYERMKKGKRLTTDCSGDNVDGTTNIIPAMDLKTLQKGYRKILDGIYAPAPYYQRVKTFLSEYKEPIMRRKPQFIHILAIIRSTYKLGIIGRERLEYWKLLFWTLFRHPRLLPDAITLAIYGYHFRKVCDKHVEG